MRHPRWLLVSVLVALVVACSDDKKDDDDDAKGPNHPPVAAFTVASTVAAGTPLAFDASASSDPDDDTLTYSWDFGNGQRGGGERIAVVYDAPGSYTAKLTVWDRRDGTAEAQQSITVSVGAVSTGDVDTLVVVRDLRGAAIAGVTVSAVAGTASAITNNEGRATISTPRGVPATLRFAKPGFAGQVKRADLPGDVEGGYLEVTLRERDGASTLADAAAGGQINGRDGSHVTFLPGSLVDAGGNPVSGSVAVAMTPIDVANEAQAFPGRFEGVRSTGEQGPIMSYGTVEFDLEGGAVQLAPGKHATIEIPIYTSLNMQGQPLAIGDTIPLWSLNERTGAWTQEGVGTVVAGDEVGSFALLAEVTHFSWWNCDDFAQPALPKPKCLVDTNHDGVLEDLTGTGYCWHYGTGPEATPTPLLIDRPGATSFGLVALEQPPAYAVSATTPVGGGVALPIPANTDITLRSYAMNGTLFGTTVVNLAAGVEEDVVVVLDEVEENPGTLAVAFPYDAAFRINARNEVDRFTFTVEPDNAFDVRVSRSAHSVVNGRVRVLNANNQQLVAADFGEVDLATTLSTGAGGTFTVEITAQNNVPGAYRLELAPAAAAPCENPVAITLPYNAASLDFDGSSTKCFLLTLAADAVLSVTDGSHPNFAGTARVFTSGGEQIAVDPVNPSDLELYVAVVQAGTYRLEIANTNLTSADMNALVVTTMTPDGTISAPSGTVTYANASTGSMNARWYVVKQENATSPVAIALNPNFISQGMRIFPAGINVSGSTSINVRVSGPSAFAHTLVQVFRQSTGSAWNFTLSALTPTEVPIGTTLDLNAAGTGLVAAYTLTATPGQEVAFGVQTSNATNPAVRIYHPTSGAVINPTPGLQNRVYTLTEGGRYTVAVTNENTESGAFQFRMNNVPAREALTLPGVIQRDITLALGEVRLFTLDAVTGRLVSLALSSNDAIEVSAVLTGAEVYDGFTQLEFGSPPRSSFSGARYMQEDGLATLVVYSPSRSTGEATGTFELQVHSPAPTSASLGERVAQTLTPRTLYSYGYSLPADGRYMLCNEYAGGSLNYASVVWGPSAPFLNYTGDLVTFSPVTDNRTEIIDELRAGANTLTMTTNGASSVSAAARLVQLQASATALTLNGGATAQAIAAACQRSYFSFAGTGGQSYTVRVTAQFDGEVRVRKLPPNGDFTVRTDPPFSSNNLGSTPLSLASTVERTVSFAIPNDTQFGNGTYLVEVDATADATGTFSIELTSP